jgi:hypothetical protein
MDARGEERDAPFPIVHVHQRVSANCRHARTAFSRKKRKEEKRVPLAGSDGVCRRDRGQAALPRRCSCPSGSMAGTSLNLCRCGVYAFENHWASRKANSEHESASLIAPSGWEGILVPIECSWPAATELRSAVRVESTAVDQLSLRNNPEPNGCTEPGDSASGLPEPRRSTL